MNKMKRTVLASQEGASGMAASIQALINNRNSLESVEQGIRVVEENPRIHTVGLHGAPNLLGEVECDASIMEGTTLQAGAVGALKGFLHPITVARHVLERLPHVILVGEGARRFSEEIGEKFIGVIENEAKDKYKAWAKKVGEGSHSLDLSQQSLIEFIEKSNGWLEGKDTTIFLAIDALNNLAGGASTSGFAYKYPGRLGDSPIIGAGLYVDTRYGGCACTHTGEMAIRMGTSRSVVNYMKNGASVKEACYEAVSELKELREGFLGPIVVHAIDKEGVPSVVGTGIKEDVKYWYWNESMESAKSFVAECA